MPLYKGAGPIGFGFLSVKFATNALQVEFADLLEELMEMRIDVIDVQHRRRFPAQPCFNRAFLSISGSARRSSPFRKIRSKANISFFSFFAVKNRLHWRMGPCTSNWPCSDAALRGQNGTTEIDYFGWSGSPTEQVNFNRSAGISNLIGIKGGFRQTKEQDDCDS